MSEALVCPVCEEQIDAPEEAQIHRLKSQLQQQRRAEQVTFALLGVFLVAFLCWAHIAQQPAGPEGPGVGFFAPLFVAGVAVIGLLIAATSYETKRGEIVF